MSPTIGLAPPSAEKCLETSRKSSCRGGTLIAEDVHDLDEHRRRVADADAYRPPQCAKCGHPVHVHDRPERHPRREPSLPSVVEVLRFRCANEACRATWRVLPLFLARHLWHPWKVVERAALPDTKPPPSTAPALRPRTEARWRTRLESSARMLVVLLAMSGGSALESVAKQVGLDGTRRDLVFVYATEARTESGERLASLGALVHRLERGMRLM
jgi:hypothetical protein